MIAAIPMQVQLDLTNQWAGSSNAHPIGVAVTLILGAALLLVPRRWAPLPILMLACFVPSGQRIVIATLDFSFLRVMVILGWLRVFINGEYGGFRRHSMDVATVLFNIVGILAFWSLRGTSAALVYSLGNSLDTLGTYFLFRLLIRDWVDLDRVIRSIAWIALPVAVAFMFERVTGRNPFSVLGGVPEITVVRQGRLRCQGAYSHPILAGCFWASLAPLIAAGWWRARSARGGVVFALICTVAIVFFCASSTPVLGLGFAFVGGAAWFIRYRLRMLRWGIVFTLFGLHLVMKAPVWHLISRVSAVGGSTGWHRYHLIDSAIRRFPEWAARGVVSTRHWGFGLGDVTNQYIAEGKRAGILGLILFVIIIAYAYRGVGRIWRRVRHSKYRVAMAWALGASLLVHSACFIGVTYFGQILLVWNMTLAAIASLELRTQQEARAARARRRAEFAQAELEPALQQGAAPVAS